MNWKTDAEYDSATREPWTREHRSTRDRMARGTGRNAGGNIIVEMQNLSGAFDALMAEGRSIETAGELLMDKCGADCESLARICEYLVQCRCYSHSGYEKYLATTCQVCAPSGILVRDMVARCKWIGTIASSQRAFSSKIPKPGTILAFPTIHCNTWLIQFVGMGQTGPIVTVLGPASEDVNIRVPGQLEVLIPSLQVPLVHWLRRRIVWPVGHDELGAQVNREAELRVSGTSEQLEYEVITRRGVRKISKSEVPKMSNIPLATVLPVQMVESLICFASSEGWTPRNPWQTGISLWSI